MNNKRTPFWIFGIVGALLSSAMLVGCGGDDTAEVPTTDGGTATVETED